MRQRAPYVELSAMASVEAHRKNIYRPPYYVHKWWARRTGSVFRGIALDLLLPQDKDVMSAYYRAHDFADIVILDPLMGGGTTIGEVLRLGCKAVGCDLNPVAWYLVTQSMRRADIPTLMAAYQQVADRVAGPISDMYRTTCSHCGGEATAQYTAWVKQVPCAACGEQADLHRSQVIMADMATKGAGLVDCPRCGHPWWVESVKSAVSCPECAHRFTPAEKRTRNTDYSCDCCGHEGRILDAIAGSELPPVHRVRALTVWCDSCGKRHQPPTHQDLAGYDVIARDVALRFDELHVPREEIPAGFNTNQMRKYGYRYWHQMFNPRQLAGLDLLFGAIRGVENQAARELLTLLASASLEFQQHVLRGEGVRNGCDPARLRPSRLHPGQGTAGGQPLGGSPLIGWVLDALQGSAPTRASLGRRAH